MASPQGRSAQVPYSAQAVPGGIWGLAETPYAHAYSKKPGSTGAASNPEVPLRPDGTAFQGVLEADCLATSRS